MADERLGASFSIDVTNLKAGLLQANRLIRESESEFKSAAAGMDNWSKSEAGLTARIKSLSSITEIQRTKINALKTQYQNLINQGIDPTSRQAVELRTQINNETAALEKNEAEIRRHTATLENLEKGLEDAGDAAEKAEGGFTVLKGAMANLVSQGITAVIDGCKQAASAMVGLVKSSLDAYASYEQLTGGVDTLFKDSSQKVQDYAANAYKTAGMTANEYMETVTGFSASLIQSLGGDTEQAAEKANMALVDMSDNANKMGTDMESIKNAYGGFAKGNFDMLDNLKLGYGGTKEEMQRLLADASKFSGIEYDISSYADIVDAIHIVQDEMGITGTTAKEASTTIQGSIASMQGAWGNLLTGLADENADIDGLITNLIDSIGTMLENLIPRITVILSGIVGLIQKLIPQLPPIIQQFLPVLIQGIMNLLKGIVAVLPTVIDTIVQVIPQLIQSLLAMLPTLLTTIIQIVVSVINALSEMLPDIVQAIIEIVPQLVQALVDAIPDLLQAAITFLLAIVDAIPYIITALVDELPNIVSSIVSVLIANIPLLLKASVQLFMALVKAIPQVIVSLYKTVPNIVKGIVSGIIDGVPKMLDAGKELIKGLWQGIKDMTGWIKDKIKGFGDSVVSGLKDFFGIHSPSTLMENVIGKNLALGIGEGFEKNIGAVNDEITDAMDFESGNINVNGRKSGGKANGGVVVYQTNNYSQAHSRFELYKSKQQTAAAVRLAMGV